MILPEFRLDNARKCKYFRADKSWCYCKEVGRKRDSKGWVGLPSFENCNLVEYGECDEYETK